MRTIKRKIFAASLVALALIGGAAAHSAQQKAADPNGADGYAYWIKDYHGKVAVFQNGNDRPEEILDCPLDSLPQEEVQRVKEGIPALDETELQHLIEAFD